MPANNDERTRDRGHEVRSQCERGSRIGSSRSGQPADLVVAEYRRAVDWAQVIKHLMAVHYPDAEQIVLVAGRQAGDPSHSQARQLYFSILQRKVLTPNDLDSLPELIERIHAFGERYSALEKPFAWTFTRQDLERRLRDPLLLLEPQDSLRVAA